MGCGNAKETFAATIVLNLSPDGLVRGVLQVQEQIRRKLGLSTQETGEGISHQVKFFQEACIAIHALLKHALNEIVSKDRAEMTLVQMSPERIMNLLADAVRTILLSASEHQAACDLEQKFNQARGLLKKMERKAC